jgi:hypothetical protein
MFNVHNAVDAIDVTFCTLVSFLLYGLVLFGLVYVDFALRRCFARKISPAKAGHRSILLADGDIKLQLLKRMYRIPTHDSTSKTVLGDCIYRFYKHVVF